MKTNDVVSLAKKHPIRKDVACPDFFEGAVLGNGDLGTIVCTKPDSIILYFGHNDIWDIRVEESHKEKVGTFKEMWKKILNEKDTFKQQNWYMEYEAMAVESYYKPYPRPYPASALYLFFDRVEYSVLGHELDISCGLVTVTLENKQHEKYYIKVFVSQRSDTVLCETVDEQGRPSSVFHRMILEPHTPDGGLPNYTVWDNGFIQLLPLLDFTDTVRPGVDKGFSVLYRMNGKTDNVGLHANFTDMTGIQVQITEGYYDQVELVRDVRTASFEDELMFAADVWKEYWQCSGVELEDDFLEQVWYHNVYFMRCALNEDCRCPGLFANWSYNNIGTAWHGDYHMNYNTQQPFWGLMGANRCHLHMPYVRLTEFLLPLATAWAHDFYELEGACFPHSAYPVPMAINPYPSTDWGWEIFETPWTVQSLWWHYTYTKDTALLRTRLYPVMRSAATFLVDYMMRPGSNPSGDDKFHLYPIIVPELYGLRNGLDRNIDGACDLAFTKFLFKAMLQAIQDLGLEKEEAVLAERMTRILEAYPEYPTAQSRWGKVYISVEGEDPNTIVYNVPANLMQVFPCEDIDRQQGSEQDYETAKRSWEHHYNEGGNDIVFYNMIGARLGTIDLERFKRYVRYSTMPNGTVADRITLSGGRYPHNLSTDYMIRMGIWFENFSLYAVIDECLIWGHTDTVELFPNWDVNKTAAFCSMRTKGAFLVSADCGDGRIKGATVYSERGGLFKMKNPWGKAMDQNGTVYESATICIEMKIGDEFTLTAVE